ncbi:protein virilizer-like [Portunus trituberculatus]|uniref:protein virilizer-like n=1 Tax=Portunus trituberculatus TaxID=210409 RepID=UPI001E1CF7BA|nr:protein virilizer-like [Portunus trituberculatus]
METLYEDINQLILVLENAGTQNADAKELSEPAGPDGEGLVALFSGRVVWTSLPSPSQDDIPAYWVSSPPHQEPDHSEMVSTNLLEICLQYAGDYDLVGSLHKLVKGQGAQALTPQKLAGKGPPRYKHSAGAIRADKRGRPFVAPMRGRPFTRGMNLRSDPFRSRPPNTSRPPSLHVDDFVALESTGHQPTGPTGYNKISFGRVCALGVEVDSWLTTSSTYSNTASPQNTRKATTTIPPIFPDSHTNTETATHLVMWRTGERNLVRFTQLWTTSASHHPWTTLSHHF